MSLPSKKNVDISKAVQTRFKAITAGVDYNYAYANVYLNMESPITSGINITCGDEEPLFADTSETLQHCKTSITIDVIENDESTREVDKQVADLLKSIGTDITWSGLAYNTTHINTYSNVLNQQGEKIANRRIEIEVQYQKNKWSN